MTKMSSKDDGRGSGGSSGTGRSGPAGLGNMFERILGEDNPVFEQIDRNAKALAQSALAKLEVVNRAEFDAQAAVLKRTRQKLELLEAEVERLTQLLQQHQNNSDD